MSLERGFTDPVWPVAGVDWVNGNHPNRLPDAVPAKSTNFYVSI
jgi:hypothetical protein